MKISSVAVLLLLVAMGCETSGGTIASNKKYFVYTDELNTRSEPGLQGTKLRLLKFGEVVTVYEIKGTGEFSNGTLDKWCRISVAGAPVSEWLNYFYVVSFGFKVDLEQSLEIKKHNSLAMNVYDELPERIYIKDVEVQNGESYFLCEIDDSSYYHKDIAFKTKVSELISAFIPSSYSNNDLVKRYRKDGETWSDLDGGPGLSTLPDDAVYLEEDDVWTVKGGNRELIKKLDRLRILDNISIRMYNFCEKFREYVEGLPKELYSYKSTTTTILSDKAILDYGIKLGMPVSVLFKIIGPPTEINGNQYVYEAASTGSAEIVVFEISNERIKGISSYFEK